jgi:hypothetical protein
MPHSILAKGIQSDTEKIPAKAKDKHLPDSTAATALHIEPVIRE